MLGSRLSLNPLHEAVAAVDVEDVPVMKSFFRTARNASATLAGRPFRPDGRRSANARSLPSPSSPAPSQKVVSLTQPGEMMFTRMGTNLIARALVSGSSAVL